MPYAIKLKASHDDLRRLCALDWTRAQIGREYGVSKSCISYHFKQMGIVRPKGPRKTGLPSRVRRPRSVEFSDMVRYARFLEEKGCCQECGMLIGSGVNWRCATYHHIDLVCDGGRPEPENCMVLHSECHNDPGIFKRLHGGRVFEKFFTGKAVKAELKHKPFDVSEGELLDLFNNRMLSVRGVAKELGRSFTCVQRALKRLENEGVLNRPLATRFGNKGFHL